jgi:hypothetical protein
MKPRQLSAVVALLFIFCGMPFNLGLTIVSGPAVPTLTVNICHPLQTATASSLSAIARPAPDAMRVVLPKSGSISSELMASLIDLRIPPESPPPKPFA